MSQTWTAPQNEQRTKAPDFALAIAGWPTIYTARKRYTLPSSGELSNASGNGFDTESLPLAGTPQIAMRAMARRPEDGASSFARIEISLVDRRISGHRQVTTLCSPEVAGKETLQDPVDLSADALRVSAIDAFSETGGLAYVGLECLRYATAFEDGSGAWLDGCVRGRLLTEASAHDAGAIVYPSMPTLFWRRAFIYKGYQDLALGHWIRAFGGVVDSISRIGNAVTVSIADTLRLAGEEQVLPSPPPSSAGNGVFQPATMGSLEGLSYGQGLFRPEIQLVLEDASHIGNGHYVLNLAGTWLGVEELAGPPVSF